MDTDGLWHNLDRFHPDLSTIDVRLSSIAAASLLGALVPKVDVSEPGLSHRVLLLSG